MVPRDVAVIARGSLHARRVRMLTSIKRSFLVGLSCLLATACLTADEGPAPEPEPDPDPQQEPEQGKGGSQSFLCGDTHVITYGDEVCTVLGQQGHRHCRYDTFIDREMILGVCRVVNQGADTICTACVRD